MGHRERDTRLKPGPRSVAWASHRWAAAGLLLAVLGPGRAAPAQDAPDFEKIRNGQFAGSDRQETQAWIDAQTKGLFAADDPGPVGERLFFDAKVGLVVNRQKSGTASQFKQGVADLVAQAFLREYQAAGGASTKPLAVCYPLAALKVFGQPNAVGCFQATIEHPHETVRLLACQGLLGI